MHGPDSTQAHLCDAEVGGYILEGHPFQDIGRFMEEGFVSFFGCMKLDAFDPVDGIHIGRFKNFAKKPFDIMILII